MREQAEASRLAKVLDANRKLQDVVKDKQRHADVAAELAEKEVAYTRAAVLEMLPRQKQEHAGPQGRQAMTTHAVAASATAVVAASATEVVPASATEVVAASATAKIVFAALPKKRGRPRLSEEEKSLRVLTPSLKKNKPNAFERKNVAFLKANFLLIPKHSSGNGFWEGPSDFEG